MSATAERSAFAGKLAVWIGTLLALAGTWLMVQAFLAALCEWGTCGGVSDDERRDVERGGVVGLILVGASPLAVAIVSWSRESRVVFLTAATSAVGAGIAGGMAAARGMPIGLVWFAAAVGAASVGGSVALRYAVRRQVAIRLAVASTLTIITAVDAAFGLLVVLVFPAFAIADRLARDVPSIRQRARTGGEP